MNHAHLMLAGLLLVFSTQLFSTTTLNVHAFHPETVLPWTETLLPVEDGCEESFHHEKPFVEVSKHPITGKWTIDGNIGAHEIRLLDFKRTVVHFQEGKKLPAALDIDHLPNGRYTLMVKDRENRLIRLEKISKK